MTVFGSKVFKKVSQLKGGNALLSRGRRRFQRKNCSPEDNAVDSHSSLSDIWLLSLRKSERVLTRHQFFCGRPVGAAMSLRPRFGTWQI